MSDVASGSHERNTRTIVVLVYDNKCHKIQGESRVSVGDKIHHNVFIIKNEFILINFIIIYLINYLFKKIMKIKVEIIHKYI